MISEPLVDLEFMEFNFWGNAEPACEDKDILSAVLSPDEGNEFRVRSLLPADPFDRCLFWGNIFR